jgi:transcriptional regulator with XRE-family HTH domain
LVSTGTYAVAVDPPPKPPARVEEVSKVRGVLVAGVARRLLRYQLLRFRESAGVSQSQAAERIDRKQPTLAAMEKGETLPAQSALEVLLGFYGVPEAFGMMRDLLRIAQSNEEDESTPTITSTVHDFTLMVGLEPYAKKIEQFDGQVVTGLLQTERYARALTEFYASHTPGLDVDNTVALRLERQEAITRETNPAELWFFTEESTFRRPVGGPEVMREQLEHLLVMTELPNVVVQMLPNELGVHSALFGNFRLMGMADGLRVAYEETLRSAYYYDASDAADAYSRVVDRLRTEALSPTRTRAAVDEIRKGFTR